MIILYFESSILISGVFLVWFCCLLFLLIVPQMLYSLFCYFILDLVFWGGGCLFPYVGAVFGFASARNWGTPDLPPATTLDHADSEMASLKPQWGWAALSASQGDVSTAPRVRPREPSFLAIFGCKLEFIFIFCEGTLQGFWLCIVLSLCKDGQWKHVVTGDQSVSPGSLQIWRSPNVIFQLCLQPLRIFVITW